MDVHDAAAHSECLYGDGPRAFAVREEAEEDAIGDGGGRRPAVILDEHLASPGIDGVQRGLRRSAATELGFHSHAYTFATPAWCNSCKV